MNPRDHSTPAALGQSSRKKALEPISKSRFRLLIVTNMFPSERFPVLGIFVKEQMEDLKAHLNVEVDLEYINAREKGKLEYLKSIFRIFRRVRKGKYDLLHIHYGLSALFLFFFRPPCPVFLTLHGADILKKQGKWVQVWLTKRLLRRVDKVFVLNAEMEETVKSLGVAYELLPCGVNTGFFQPAANGGAVSFAKRIIFPGSPGVAVKNFPLFLEVIQLLEQQSSFPISYACIENLSRTEVKDLLNSSHCLLMTSISEGSPQVVKEALGCGLPVVSVPVGDVSTVLAGLPDCWVAGAHEANELSELVQRVLNARPDAHRIRQGFLEKKRYDSDSVARRLVENYQAALSFKSPNT